MKKVKRVKFVAKLKSEAPLSDEECSNSYKADPSLENYVKLRRENPGARIEVGIHGRMNHLFWLAPHLKKLNIDPMLLAGALDADERCISELCLRLMELICEQKASGLSRKRREPDQEKDLTFSVALVNYLVELMFDSMSRIDHLEVSRDLIVLLCYQLLGDRKPALLRKFEFEALFPNTVSFGAHMLERGERPGIRKIAKLLKVDASTLSILFKGRSLERELASELKALRNFSKSETPFKDAINGSPFDDSVLNEKKRDQH